jgi:hypothetical protein
MENKEELTNKVKQLFSYQNPEVLTAEKSGNPYINLIVFLMRNRHYVIFLSISLSGK